MEARREEFEIVVLPDGRVRVRVKGIKGPRCVEATRFLEEMGRVLERRFTSEYYEQEETRRIRAVEE